MAQKKNSKLAALLLGPTLVIGGAMALWQNEGRFDYYAAARQAEVIEAPRESPLDAIAYTAALRTDIPIAGEYVDAVTGYLMIRRHAEIYAWEESTDSDGNTTWSRGWQSRLESNARNAGIVQRLSSTRLYPERYQLGSLEIDPRDIHFVDDAVPIPLRELSLSARGKALGLQPAGDSLYLDKGGDGTLGDERVSYRGIPSAARASYFGTIADGRGVGRAIAPRDGLIADLIADDGILHHLVNGDRETALAKLKADLLKVVWLVRVGGTAAICFGFAIFFSVFASLLYGIPVIGRVVETGVLLVSLVLGLSVALLVIAAGLLFHNPLSLALPVALVIVGVVWTLRRSRRTGRHAKTVLERRLAAQQAPGAGSPPARPSAAETWVGQAPVGQGSAPKPAQDSAAAVQPSATPPRMAQPDAAQTSVVQPAGQPSSAAQDGAWASLIPEEGPIERAFTHLAALAMADGPMNSKERNFLVAWGRANGVAPDQMNALLSAVQSDPHAAGQATREDLELLALMALADGAVSTAEWGFLGKIAARLGVAHQELRALIRQVESGRALAA